MQIGEALKQNHCFPHSPQWWTHIFDPKVWAFTHTSTRSLINPERLGPTFWWLEQPTIRSVGLGNSEWILHGVQTEPDLPQRIERSHRELRRWISKNIRFWRRSFRFSPVFFQRWEVLRGFVLESERKTNNKKWIYWRWHPTVAHRGLVDSRWSSKFSASMFCWSSWILPISSHLVSVRGWFTRASLCLGRGEKVCQVVQMPFAIDDLVIQNLGFGTVFNACNFQLFEGSSCCCFLWS